MPNPQSFIGAVIIAVIGVIVAFILDRVFIKKKEENANKNKGNIGASNKWERFFIFVFFSRGLRKYLSKYKKVLGDNILKERWVGFYADLHLFPMVLRPIDALLGSEQTKLDLSVQDAIEQFSNSGLVLLGESGAGKSTSIKMVTQLYCQKEKEIPILIELRNYRRPDSLLGLLAHEVGHRTWLLRGLKLGRFLLLLDGMNEISQELIPSFVNDLNLLRTEYPTNKVVTTCRPADYSDSFPAFIHMKLQPLTRKSIEQFLVSVLGNSEGQHLFATMDDRLFGLCENPYMLTMLAIIYKSTKMLPANRATLYKGFLNEFLVQEATKGVGSVSIHVKHSLLSTLACFMENKIVSIEISRVQSIFGQKLVELREEFEHQYFAPDVLDELLRNGLLRYDFGNISFMHQSIQEYYTAREIAERLNGNKTKVIELLQYFNDPRWNETFRMLAGLLDDATELVQVMQRSNLFLASECIQASSCVDPKVVDWAIIKAVTEFKFGKEPFNYPLIFSLKNIGDRRSSNLSQRVIDDMIHWCEKYATVTPRTLVGIETDDLIKIVVNANNPYILSDAIWTLGVRKEVRAVNALVEILLDKESPFRADAARALGKIGDKRATAALLSCIKPSEPRKLLPFVFMALGSIADKAAFQPLIDYLSDINNPYREVPAWALLGIADQSIGDFLIQNIYKGTALARANFVFLLGQYKYQPGLNELIDLLPKEHEPYVREDIAFALGEYGDPIATPVLVKSLDDPDSLVRIRVVEALEKIGGKDVETKLEGLLNDESEFVREAAEQAMIRINKKP